MYNRYIPQTDGSYRRNRVQEPQRPRPQKQVPPAQEAPCPPPEPPKQHCVAEKPHPAQPCGKGDSFLRQLLPKDFDSGDLIVVLLLLLMAGDSEESRSNALLTLALYFMK